jgi:integrase
MDTMAGSIRKRPDKGADAYELRVFLGRDASGRVRHKSQLFRGTQRAAERALAKMVTLQADRPAVVPSESTRPFGPATTINDAIAAWQLNGWQDLSPSTTRRYASIWSIHIKSSIGKRSISSLGPYDVELYLRSLKTSGLSEASVRQTRAVMHRACRLARKWSGNALPNPVADTELPDWALRDGAEPIRAPNTDEVRSLLASAESSGPRLHGFVLVVAATGMRRGEACALRWGDVDLDQATVVIDESVVTTKGGVEVKAPKSRSGLRRVALDPMTTAALSDLRGDTEMMGLVGNFEVDPDHFIFASELPGIVPPHPDAMSHAFSRIRTESGVARDIHLHSLRHFQATQLDPVISEAQKQTRLGWATAHMARHYTDGIDEEDRRAAEHIGRLLRGDEVGV